MIEPNWGLAFLGICGTVSAAILKYGPPLRKNNGTVKEKSCEERMSGLRELLEMKIDNLDNNVTELKVTVKDSAKTTQGQITIMQTTMTDILKAVKVN